MQLPKPPQNQLQPKLDDCIVIQSGEIETGLVKLAMDESEANQLDDTRRLELISFARSLEFIP